MDETNFFANTNGKFVDDQNGFRKTDYGRRLFLLTSTWGFGLFVGNWGLNSKFSFSDFPMKMYYDDLTMGPSKQ
jgi:hypothetical protein